MPKSCSGRAGGQRCRLRSKRWPASPADGPLLRAYTRCCGAAWQRSIINNFWGGILGIAALIALILIVGVIMILKVASMSEKELRGERCASEPILRKPVSTATPMTAEPHKPKAE